MTTEIKHRLDECHNHPQLKDFWEKFRELMEVVSPKCYRYRDKIQCIILERDREPDLLIMPDGRLYASYFQRYTGAHPDEWVTYPISIEDAIKIYSEGSEEALVDKIKTCLKDLVVRRLTTLHEEEAFLLKTQPELD